MGMPKMGILLYPKMGTKKERIKKYINIYQKNPKCFIALYKPSA